MARRITIKCDTCGLEVTTHYIAGETFPELKSFWGYDLCGECEHRARTAAFVELQKAEEIYRLGQRMKDAMRG